MFYDTRTWKPRARLSAETAVDALVVSPDSRWLAVVMQGKDEAGYNTHIVSVATGKVAGSIDANGGIGEHAGTVAFAPDGSWLVSSERLPGGQYVHAGIKELGKPDSYHSETPVDSLGDESAAQKFYTSKDGKILVVEWESSITVAHAPSGHPVAYVKMTNGSALSPHARFLAAYTAKGVVLIEVASGHSHVLQEPGCQGTQDPLFSHDGSRLLVGGDHGTLCAFDTGTGKLVKRYAIPAKSVNADVKTLNVRAIAWTAADDAVLGALLDGTPMLWRVKTGHKIPIAHEADIGSELERDDGAIVLLTRWGWPIATITNGPHVAELPPPPDVGKAYPAAQSDDGQYVAFGWTKGKVVSTRDGHVLSTFPIASRYKGFGFDPKGRFIYPDDGPLQVRDTKTGAVVLDRPSCTN